MKSLYELYKLIYDWFKSQNIKIINLHITSTNDNIRVYSDINASINKNIIENFSSFMKINNTNIYNISYEEQNIKEANLIVSSVSFDIIDEKILFKKDENNFKDFESMIIKLIKEKNKYSVESTFFQDMSNKTAILINIGFFDYIYRKTSNNRKIVAKKSKKVINVVSYY